MKKAAILTSYQRDYKKHNFYFESEKELKRIFGEQEMELCYVSPYYYDEKHWTFSEHVIITDKDMKIIKEPYTPDILRVRTSQWLTHLDHMFAYAPFKTVPSMRLKHIESNKFDVYQFLPDFQPKTTLLTSFYYYPWLQKQFTKNVVVKPIWGTWGYGIEFYTQDELKSPEIFRKYTGTESLHIVQNFQKFTWWYPGIVKWNHDVRIVYRWTKPFMNYIRQPKKWSLKSYIAWGGTQFSIPMKDLPKELLTMSKKIQKKIGIQEEDIYTCDFARCSKDKRPYLIEINSAPGIWFPDEDKKYRKKFYKDLAVYFGKLCE